MSEDTCLQTGPPPPAESTPGREPGNLGSPPTRPLALSGTGFGPQFACYVLDVKNVCAIERKVRGGNSLTFLLSLLFSAIIILKIIFFSIVIYFNKYIFN